MGAIKVLKSDDGKPYISLEDLSNELEALRISQSLDDDNASEFLDLILLTLNSMEQEYYTKMLTHAGTINLQDNVKIEPIPAKIIHTTNDPKAAIVIELLRKLKLTKRKLNKEQSKIADKIDEIAGANLIIRNWVSPEELNNFKTKMVGIRTMCSRANLKYEYWIMMVEAVQKKAMTKDELLKMIQQEILNGKSKKSK